MNKKKLLIGIIGLIGFITTIKLGIIYYNANFNPYALSSFCSVNDFVDCDGIAKTSESQFLGVPLAFWGMFLYSFIFLLLFADKLKNYKLLKFLEVFKNPMSYISILGLISFTISMLLLCISLFELKKICVLCAFTYILNLAIGLIAVHGIGFKKAFKDSIQDFIDGVKIKKYGIALGIVALLATSFLAYTRITYVFAPHVKRQAEFKEFRAKTNKYAVSGNLLGSENPEITVQIFTDYRCPMCKAHNIMVHKLAKEHKNIKIEHYSLPLDTECNKYLRQEFHHGSCTMAQFAIAAEKQGKFWDMNNKLFEKQPNNIKEILEIAQGLKLDIDKLLNDANSFETMRRVQDDIEKATNYGINGTPTTVINGEVRMGMKPYAEMKEWIKNAK